jgi:hypothetical protein
MTTGLGDTPMLFATIMVTLSAMLVATATTTVFRGSPSSLQTTTSWIFVLCALLCFYTSGARAYVTTVPGLPAFGFSSIVDRDHALYLDSGCTKTVIRNARKLRDLRAPDNYYTIQGVGGDVSVTQMGDLPLTLKDASGKPYTRIIKNCLVAPEAPANLLATRDLQEAGIGFNIPPAPDTMATVNVTDETGCKIHFPLAERNGLYMLPFCSDIMTIFSGVASHQLRALTTLELWHLRLCHAHTSKIAKLSHNCVGIPHKLAEQTHPCHTCHEAKAARQDYPASIDHSDDDDILSMDLVDMGQDSITHAGFQYMTIFIVVRTRYAMVFCHKSRKDLPDLLKRACARLGRYPRILRSDGACEYDSAAVDAFCLEHNIDQQHSNPHQQFGNAMPETMVNAIGRGIRISLHDANLPPQFWSYAAINYVDVYNNLPHSALDFKTPWELEKGTPPDVSWFKPFGCRATVFIGDHKEQLWHHKLAARGEPCIYLGLAFSRGMKGWICWNPENNRYYCTRNVVFDETFMPLRPHDQRILGHYDTAPRTRLAKAVYQDMANAENNAAAIDDLPTSRMMDPFEAISAEENDDVSQPPAGRDSHDEADLFVEEVDEQDS